MSYREGGLVKVHPDNDNDNYDEFRNKKLRIIYVARNTDQHPGYDNSMEGMALYDLYNETDQKAVNSSLYEYELIKW